MNSKKLEQFIYEEFQDETIWTNQALKEKIHTFINKLPNNKEKEHPTYWRYDLGLNQKLSKKFYKETEAIQHVLKKLKLKSLDELDSEWHDLDFIEFYWVDKVKGHYGENPYRY